MQAYAQLHSRALVGIQAPAIQIEAHVSNGLPGLTLVGLPETSVKESRDRVRSALISSGFQLPPKRITLNLAPADLPKHGSRYDLPIALSILVSTQQLVTDYPLTDYEWLGELGLNGEIRAINGVLPALLAAKSAGKKIIIPQANLAEAALISGVEVYGAKHLLEVVALLVGETEHGLTRPEPLDQQTVHYTQDLSDVRGQLQAKRVLEVCASGHHSLLMVGPPGSGKSMLASRLVTLLPNLNESQAIEVATVESVAGKMRSSEQFFQRKVIASHHSATVPSMVGGGSSASNLKPGAVSLAHQGILFLDELPEFNRSVLEALREPLETKQVEISRVNHQLTFPADALLVAAMNPSPSGYFADDPLGRCCQFQRYSIITKINDNLQSYLIIHIWIRLYRLILHSILFSLQQRRLNVYY